MIEVVSCPSTLEAWEPDGRLPYLELYGETRPRLCSLPAHVLPAGGATDVQAAAPTPIYEYFWTIGLPETAVSNWQKHRVLARPGADPDIGADIELCFPRSGGWRVCEAIAAVQVLRPLPHQEQLMEKVANYWKSVSPIVQDASDLIKLMPTPISPGASTLLSVLARMHITSLPPVDGFAWSVEKTTHKVGSEVMDGIRWRLPKTVFNILGNRLAGSIAVYFVPSHPQLDHASASGEDQLEEMAILARARIHADQWVPSPSDYIRLRVHPCLRSEPERTSRHHEMRVRQTRRRRSLISSVTVAASAQRARR